MSHFVRAPALTQELGGRGEGEGEGGRGRREGEGRNFLNVAILWCTCELSGDLFCKHTWLIRQV